MAVRRWRRVAVTSSLSNNGIIADRFLNWPNYGEGRGGGEGFVSDHPGELRLVSRYESLRGCVSMILDRLLC